MRRILGRTPVPGVSKPLFRARSACLFRQPFVPRFGFATIESMSVYTCNGNQHILVPYQTPVYRRQFHSRASGHSHKKLCRTLLFQSKLDAFLLSSRCWPRHCPRRCRLRPKPPPIDAAPPGVRYRAPAPTSERSARHRNRRLQLRLPILPRRKKGTAKAAPFLFCHCLVYGGRACHEAPFGRWPLAYVSAPPLPYRWSPSPSELGEE